MTYSFGIADGVLITFQQKLYNRVAGAILIYKDRIFEKYNLIYITKMISLKDYYYKLGDYFDGQDKNEQSTN